MNRRSVARFVVALGMAAAVALGTAGPAGALTSLADAGTATEAYEAAPTENLRKLANAIGITNKGIYQRVTAPAGLNVGPIQISIKFGSERYTRNYDNAGTNDLLSYPPLNGAARRENWKITLTELGPGGVRYHHDFGSQIDVVPLYTVTTSNLYFGAGGCDPFGGAADPTIVWADPAGVQRRVDKGGFGGFDGPGPDPGISEFSGRWTGVDVNTGLTAPRIKWLDRDPGGPTLPSNYTVRRGSRLLPFAASYPTRDPVVHEVQETLRDLGGDCDAQVRYFVTWAPEPPAI